MHGPDAARIDSEIDCGTELDGWNQCRNTILSDTLLSMDWFSQVLLVELGILIRKTSSKRIGTSKVLQPRVVHIVSGVLL